MSYFCIVCFFFISPGAKDLVGYCPHFATVVHKLLHLNSTGSIETYLVEMFIGRPSRIFVFSRFRNLPRTQKTPNGQKRLSSQSILVIFFLNIPHKIIFMHYGLMATYFSCRFKYKRGSKCDHCPKY